MFIYPEVVFTICLLSFGILENISESTVTREIAICGFAEIPKGEIQAKQDALLPERFTGQFTIFFWYVAGTNTIFSIKSA